MSETSKKGDIAVTKVIADLTEKGYDVLVPISEHKKFDLVVYKDEKFLKIQVKYSGSENGCHKIRGETNRQNHGVITTKYKDGDFDYYAVYLDDKKLVIYPSIKFAGKYFRTEVTELERHFYWFEDFVDFTDDAEKRSLLSFGLKSQYKPRTNYRKVERPSQEELAKMVWEMPTVKVAEKFGVTDKAIEKWCKIYGIEKPKRGFWKNKNNAVLA